MYMQDANDSGPVSDLSVPNGRISDDLKDHLAKWHLADLGLLLPRRGIHTLWAFAALSGNDRAVLLGKARLLYEAFDNFSSNLHAALDQLFEDCEACLRGRNALLSTIPVPLQPGSVSNAILGTVAPAYVLPPCAGGGSSNANNGARSSAGPRTPGFAFVRPGLLGTPHDFRRCLGLRMTTRPARNLWLMTWRTQGTLSEITTSTRHSSTSATAHNSPWRAARRRPWD